MSTPSLQMAQGTRLTYTVALGSKPAANQDGEIPDVYVAISGQPDNVNDKPGSAGLSHPDNWSSPRTVTVHAAADAQVTSVAVDLAHTAPGYTSPDPPLKLTVKSSTDAGVAINPTSSGNHGRRQRLLHRGADLGGRRQTVNVNVSGAADDVRVSRTRLSFSTSNWDREQTVTVTLAEDDDAVQDAAVTLTHTVTGANEYENADPAVPKSRP